MNWLSRWKRRREIKKYKIKVCVIYGCLNEVPEKDHRRYCDYHRNEGDSRHFSAICSVCNYADSTNSVCNCADSTNWISYCQECYESAREEEYKKEFARKLGIIGEVYKIDLLSSERKVKLLSSEYEMEFTFPREKLAWKKLVDLLSDHEMI